jgi:N,N'-diacetyllegionaminate synthase
LNNCYIIAEAGVNHNGSEELAIQLVEAASAAQADAVKFQTFKAENVVSKDAKTAQYQKKQTGNDNQFAMLKKLEISKELHVKLIDKCKQLDIEFLSTPFDIRSTEFLLELGMKKIKIPSGELTNIPFINKLAMFDVPMILSTGMSSLQEVKNAVDEIKSVRQKNNFNKPLSEVLSILHCTSNYPAHYKDVNLKAMHVMAKQFTVPVGYSDHTEGIFVSVCSVAMGASIIEKHFTLDKNMPGPDHKASIDPEELKLMVTQIRSIEQCLGDGVKRPRKSELPVRNLVRRSIILKTDKKANDILKLEDITLLRPGNGIPPSDMKKVIGRRLLVACSAGSMLKWNHLG